MTTSSRATKNAPDAGQGIEGNVPTPNKEHKNMPSLPAPTQTVNLPDATVAPHIAAWDLLAAATNPVIPFDQAHPLTTAQHVPWCFLCRDAAADTGDSAPAHDVTSTRHLSDWVSIPRFGRGETWTTGHRIDSLDVRVTQSVTAPTPSPTIELWETTSGQQRSFTILPTQQARQLIVALTAAVDLTDGQDDWSDGPVPYLPTGKA